MRKFKWLFVAFIALASVSYAQEKTTAIEVSVVDQDGAVIPGARVTLVQSESDKAKAETDSEGKARFQKVSPGRYVITAESAGINRVFRQPMNVDAGTPIVVNIEISFQPCWEERSEPKSKPSDLIAAVVTRELIDIHFGKNSTKDEKQILVPRNIKPDWLRSDQLSKLSILSRDEVQGLTDSKKDGGLLYYSISEMTMHGDCVAVTMTENVAIKGQREDANMAGGGTVYEFRLVNGRWVGQVLSRWIS